ncbi:MAG: hypothetical protein ACFB5Z_11245 [Elainellaceae cyanobacterium]
MIIVAHDILNNLGAGGGVGGVFFHDLSDRLGEVGVLGEEGLEFFFKEFLAGLAVGFGGGFFGGGFEVLVFVNAGVEVLPELLGFGPGGLPEFFANGGGGAAGDLGAEFK